MHSHTDGLANGPHQVPKQNKIRSWVPRFHNPEAVWLTGTKRLDTWACGDIFYSRHFMCYNSPVRRNSSSCELYVPDGCTEATWQSRPRLQCQWAAMVLSSVVLWSLQSGGTVVWYTPHKLDVYVDAKRSLKFKTTETHSHFISDKVLIFEYIFKIPSKGQLKTKEEKNMNKQFTENILITSSGASHLHKYKQIPTNDSLHCGTWEISLPSMFWLNGGKSGTPYGWKGKSVEL